MSIRRATSTPGEAVAARRMAAFAIAATLALVACASGPGSTSTPAPATVGPNISTPPTTAPSDAPSEAPVDAIPSASPEVDGPPAGSPEASGPLLDTMFDAHGAPGLEAQLPAYADGIPLAHFSFVGEDVLASGDRANLDALLAAVEKDAGDISLAGAVDPTGTLGALVTAFRVEGVEGGALLAALTGVVTAGSESPDPTGATVAEKSVTQVQLGPGMPEELRALEAHYLYASGDIVYLVHGSVAGATALIGELP